MSIVEGTLPDPYSPVSAEIWYSLNSTSSNVSDFKYIINVNTIDLVTASATTVGTFVIPPRPLDGYGLFTPHKLLNSYLSYDLQPFTGNVKVTYNSVLKFNFNY